MNWLAHVFVSEPAVEFRLGNLLADVVRGDDRLAMTETFLRGALLHKAIDQFTDAHPVVRRSRARLSAVHRRYSNALIDVFYDHLLATHWQHYSATSLDVFTKNFYADIATTHLELPIKARQMLERIARHDMLGSYRELSGVERSLQRLSMRLALRRNRSFELEKSVGDLVEHYEHFAADFNEFFPQLIAHAAMIAAVKQ